MTFEEAIDIVDTKISRTNTLEENEAIELAADSLAFAAALHDMFFSTGVVGPDQSLNKLQSAIDGHLGELAAAAIFLSNLSTEVDVVKALQGIHTNLTQEGGNTPSFVVEGYSRLAKRIQALKAVREVREVVRMEALTNLGED